MPVSFPSNNLCSRRLCEVFRGAVASDYTRPAVPGARTARRGATRRVTRDARLTSPNPFKYSH